MNKVVRIVLFIVITIVIVGLILYPKLRPEETGAQVSAQQESSILPVEAVVIQPRRIENIIKITGAIIANESVALKSEISGKIEKIYFQEGQRVKKGDLLLEINDEEMVAQVERLKYTQKLNEDMEFRQRQLLEKEAISREEYDIALTTLNTTQSDIKEREARLAKHKIYAPFNGIIGLRHVSEGSYISPADLVANMYNINPIKIEFSVPGKYSTVVNKGDTINFTTEASEDEFTGTIYAVEPRIDPTTRTLLIRAICRNDEEVLIPGQFANINYILDVLPAAMMVPSESIIPELNSHKVYTFRNGLVDQAEISIGLRTENEVQITKGVDPGDTVITTGILQVRQGMPVNITNIN
ncbi:MAG: efflux RND transporter periplasmic adaptor subunit [Cyclobacteriaceae bacterium]|nr:efflux RND transporter periplasmic adaptor subunit [Cyclobacteriaceae bacterium]